MIKILLISASILNAQDSSYLALRHQFDLIPMAPQAMALRVLPNKALVLPMAPMLLPQDAVAPSEFETKLEREWRKILSELKSTQEHSEFLKQNKTPVMFTQLEDGRLGEHEDGKLLFDREGIEKITQLIRQKNRALTEDQLAHVVAVKLLYVAAHETRHVLIHKEMQNKIGFDYQLATIENEVIDYAEAPSILAELKTKYAQIWNAYQIPLDNVYNSIIQAAQKGPNGLEDYVRRSPAYAKIPSIFTVNRQELCKEHSQKAEVLTKVVKRTKWLQIKIPKTEDAKQRQKYEAELAKYPSLETAQAVLDSHQAKAAIEGDPAKFAAVQKFYRDKLDELTKSYQARNK